MVKHDVASGLSESEGYLTPLEYTTDTSGVCRWTLFRQFVIIM